jgi:hypothetical protein
MTVEEDRAGRRPREPARHRVARAHNRPERDEPKRRNKGKKSPWVPSATVSR